MGEIAQGKIVDVNEHGLMVFVPYQNHDRVILRKYEKVLVELSDGRCVSPEQKKKAHALIGEIAEWVGDLPAFIKRQLKMEFMADRMQALQKKLFSLRDCDMTTAREFISYLIDFMLEHDVPSRTPLYELCEDIEKYVYACLMTKKCAVCGKKAELHHFDQIGMGGDRTTLYQIGMRVISLCREHHTTAHTKGRSWLIDELHLIPIKLTVEIGKKYKLTKKNLGA